MGVKGDGEGGIENTVEEIVERCRPDRERERDAQKDEWREGE